MDLMRVEGFLSQDPTRPDIAREFALRQDAQQALPSIGVGLRLACGRFCGGL